MRQRDLNPRSVAPSRHFEGLPSIIPVLAAGEVETDDVLAIDLR